MGLAAKSPAQTPELIQVGSGVILLQPAVAQGMEGRWYLFDVTFSAMAVGQVVF